MLSYPTLLTQTQPLNQMGNRGEMQSGEKLTQRGRTITQTQLPLMGNKREIRIRRRRTTNNNTNHQRKKLQQSTSNWRKRSHIATRNKRNIEHLTLKTPNAEHAHINTNRV